MERKDFVKKINHPFKKFVLCFCWEFLDQAKEVAMAAFLCVIESCLINGYKANKLLKIEEVFPDVVFSITDEEILNSFKIFMSGVHGDRNRIFPAEEMEWVSHFVKDEKARKEIEWMIWQYMKDDLSNPNVKKSMDKVQWITTEEERNNGELVLESKRQMPRNDLARTLYQKGQYEELLIVLFEDGAMMTIDEVVRDNASEMAQIMNDAVNTLQNCGFLYA